jgi:hypothetical protein
MRTGSGAIMGARICANGGAVRTMGRMTPAHGARNADICAAAATKGSAATTTAATTATD